DRQGVNPTGLLVLVADDGCSVAVAVSVGGTARAGDACHDGCVLGLRVAGQAVRVLGAYGGEVVHDASLIARGLLAARLPLNFLWVCRWVRVPLRCSCAACIQALFSVAISPPWLVRTTIPERASFVKPW